MRRYCLAGLLLACVASASAQAPYRIGPPASWIKLHKPNLAAPAVRTEGWEYVLTDRQESIGPDGLERYWHAAYRVIDQAAVGDNSQIEVEIDSSYQRLVLHEVTVWRGARGLNRLTPRSIHVAARETELDDRIFNGMLSVVVVIEDVRPGDIVEYSYTRLGANPVFRGHYMASLQFQYSAPVAAQYLRVRWQGSRPLHLHEFGTTPKPVISRNGAVQEYEWVQNNVAPVRAETDLPDWYHPYGTLQVTDFASWREVAAWGDSLFPVAAVPAALRAVVELIRTSSQSDEQRVLQALRWVQDEIRYTGIEIGANSHRPYAPAVVLQRRYGDCKDKALLLVTILRALGIAARPALVSTVFGGHAGDYAPTATLFDHAIVEVTLAGRDYWIDPTDVDQRGGLVDVAAYYGAALPLGVAVDSLVTMPELRPPSPTTDIVASFDVGNVGEPTEMNVETTYSGRTANNMRSSLSSSSREELQRNYVDYYAKLYPSIRSEQLPIIQDDQARNVLRLVERYSIPEFWTGDSSSGHTGEFEPLELSDLVPSGTAVGRNMPLAVSHPVHVRYIINARFQPGWSIRTRRENVATPAAKFTYASSVKDKVLTLSYEYETLADHVAPALAASHIKDMARVRDLLFYRVTPPHQGDASGAASMNWSVLLVAIFAATLACMGALRVSRARFALAGATSSTGDAETSIAPPRIPRDEPVGLGGWLILVAIGVIVSPVRILVNTAKTLSAYSTTTWSRLTTPGTPQYHAMWAPTLMYELVGNVVLFVFTSLLIYLFFKRKRQFPVVYIAVMLGNILFNVTDVLLSRLLPTDPTTLSFRTWVPGLIWVWYMLRSRRVRNTFVN